MAKRTTKSKTRNRKLQSDGFIFLEMVPKTPRGNKSLDKHKEWYRQGRYEAVVFIEGDDAIRGSGYRLVHQKTFVYVLPQEYDPIKGKGIANIGVTNVIDESTGRRHSDIHIFTL